MGEIALILLSTARRRLLGFFQLLEDGLKHIELELGLVEQPVDLASETRHRRRSTR
jgi:hypothetical protein